MLDWLLGLTDDGAPLPFSRSQLRRLIRNADQIKVILNERRELRTADTRRIRVLLRGVVNPYEKEYDEPLRGNRIEPHYPPKNIGEQLALFSGLYPALDGSCIEEVVATRACNVRNKAHLLIWPKLSSLARVNGLDRPYDEDFSHCLLTAFDNLAKVRPFEYRRYSSPKHTRVFGQTKIEIKKLEKETPGDYVAAPVQSGYGYLGWSTRFVRWECEHSFQFAAPSWIIAHYLMVYPDRLGDSYDPHILCPGDESGYGEPEAERKEAYHHYANTSVFVKFVGHIGFCNIFASNDFGGQGAATVLLNQE